MDMDFNRWCLRLRPPLPIKQHHHHTWDFYSICCHRPPISATKCFGSPGSVLLFCYRMITHFLCDPRIQRSSGASTRRRPRRGDVYLVVKFWILLVVFIDGGHDGLHDPTSSPVSWIDTSTIKIQCPDCFSHATWWAASIFAADGILPPPPLSLHGACCKRSSTVGQNI